MVAVRKKKKTGQSKKTTGARHHPHHCTARCKHKCGDVGGRTQGGRPCGRLGGWGVTGKTHGVWALCVDHDPDIKVDTSYAFDGDLVGKQTLFVLEYCGRAKCNATEAAKLAGYTGTREVLQSTGAILMSKAKIKAAILKRFDALSAPGEEIIKRMTDDARGDMAPFIQFDSRKRPKVLLTPELLLKYGTLIKEIETDPDTGYIRKIKLNDSQAARRDLAKIRRLFSDAPTINVFQLQELTDEELQQRMALSRTKLRAPPKHGPNGS